MTEERQQVFVQELKNHVLREFPLSQLSDEELQLKIEELVQVRLEGRYLPLDQRVSIVKQVYSSIRGFGILDTIMSDDTITEVMINGPDNIFIEQSGRVHKMDKAF